MPAERGRRGHADSDAGGEDVQHDGMGLQRGAARHGHSDISVDKVLEMAKTVVTIQIRLPKSKQTVSKVMLMKRHQKIAFLFNENFWVTR